MVDLKDLFVDYELYGKQYRMTPMTVERNFGFGDAGIVEVKFIVKVLDLDCNIDCMTVTYLYKETSFETSIVVDDYHIYSTYEDYMLWKEGSFSAPSPITTMDIDKVIDLLNKFVDYLQIKHMVTDKTQFSSETHEDNHEDVQRSSLDERTNPNHLYDIIKEEIKKQEDKLEKIYNFSYNPDVSNLEKCKIEFNIRKLYDALNSVKDLDL